LVAVVLLEAMALILYSAPLHLMVVELVEQAALLVVPAGLAAVAVFLVAVLVAAVPAIRLVHLHLKAIMVEQRLLQRVLTVVVAVAVLVLLVAMVLEALAVRAVMERHQAFLDQVLPMQAAVVGEEMMLALQPLAVVVVGAPAA
jgi:hypothetical protein